MKGFAYPAPRCYTIRMAETLQQEIDSLRSSIEEWRRKIELAEAELRGLERAAKYMPAHPATEPVKSKRTSRRGGRQPGAISNRWKAVLGELTDGLFDEDTVVNVVFELESRKIKPTEVRRIFEGYIEHGYIEIGPDNLFRVTDYAVQKLDLKKDEGPDAAGPTTDGSVAERSNAPDSKSGGAAPEKPAPVGSNPTASAPSHRVRENLLGGVSLPGSSPTPKPPPWRR